MANTFDLSKVTYSLTALLNTGEQLQLEPVAENIAWEENEKELAVRLNLTLRDAEVKGGRLSKQLALCTVIFLYADWGAGRTEIFRGTVWEWSHSEIDGDSIVLTCYDLLYYLQKSKDNVYYAKGKKTKAIITSILNKWQVPLGNYTAPDLTHKKILYKNKAVSAMLTELLTDAKDMGGYKSVVRAREGKADILAQGSNLEVWSFTASSNLLATQDKYSMVNLITRVIVTGKDDSKGRPKVEATLNGKIEYGILQEIKSRGSSSLKDAKKEAQKLLDEKGKPEQTITLTAPDFPLIRKGDKIHVSTDRMTGYFFVKGVSHNATRMQMQMEVEPVE